MEMTIEEIKKKVKITSTIILEGFDEVFQKKAMEISEEIIAHVSSYSFDDILDYKDEKVIGLLIASVSILQMIILTIPEEKEREMEAKILLKLLELSLLDKKSEVKK